MFHIGQKVVCVDDSPPPPGRPVYWPMVVKGQVYTIVGFDIEDSARCGIGLILAEARLGFIPPWKGEMGWRRTRFRPVQERKTDISVFTEILTKTKAPEPVA
jgi:hypothetical protein